MLFDLKYLKPCYFFNYFKLFLTGQPAYLVNVDACNLKAFCLNPQNRKDKSDDARTSIFSNIQFIVDRLHIQGHKGWK